MDRNGSLNEFLNPNSTSSPRNSKEESDKKDSLRDIIMYINRQLYNYGYPAPLNFFDSKDDNSVKKIVECISSLLQDHQKDFGTREELDDKNRRLQSDYDIACSSNKGLKKNIEVNEREIDSLKSRILRTENELKCELEKHKLTKDELAKTKSNMQYTKIQAAHEIKKREVEYTRFKEKMQKLLNDNYRKAKIGLQMMNPVSKSSKHHSNASNFSDHGLPIKTGDSIAQEEESPDAEMFKQIVADAENREKELLQENSKLRKLLFDVQNHVSTFIESHAEREAPIDPELANLQTPDSYNPKTARFQLPFEMFANNVEEEIKELLLALKYELENRPNMVAEYEAKEEENRQLQLEIDSLRNQLVEATTFVEEAQNMIYNFMESGFKDGQGEFKLNVSGNEITIPEYDELDVDLELKRKQLNQERKAFTESLIRLGKDRDQLLKERIDFEREKRAWKTLHPTPGSRKSRANILSDRRSLLVEETPTPPQKFQIQPESPITPFLEKYKVDFDLINKENKPIYSKLKK
ncbi:Afadin and alpha-actinin-binding-domain-containing protein [Glomus cerebriforme]|uniref:Afadin and alpha-actinin-binding-domain-containing protein n=1 Tax=Glomus cerebriforme TaxID=658196 RepID=A0A397TKK8_9GLOM|nr:Afadin and alpha-actinin-binding-domain-containing protein [Glomus cerebriforme]